MAKLNEWFTVHPRKRVGRTPLTDWAGRHIEITDKLDVNVFATAAEAYKWVAKMAMRYDESHIPTKRAYVVSFHAMG